MTRLWVAPPLKRTWAEIASRLMIVTSSMSRRTMRLRSRCGVLGSRQSAGKSAAMAAICARCSSLSSARRFFALLPRSAPATSVVHAQLLIPIGLERVSDQTVVRIDLHEAAAGELDFMLGPLDALAMQLVDLIDASAQLVLHLERHLQRSGRHRVEEQLADGVVNARARNVLADPSAYSMRSRWQTYIGTWRPCRLW